jgi:uncharacterized membrane protein YdbT with pleckstrin-like domain
MKNFESFHFSGQKEGEKILLVTRRHWFNILENLASVFAMILMLVISFVILPRLFPVFSTQDFQIIFLFLENLFAMIIWIIFFLIWIDYYFDVWIITNCRIVNVEQKGLFSREVSELELEKIQDITTDVLGIIPTFLNYGDVLIQTAGEKERFVFKDVPDPYAIKDLIMNLRKQRHREETNELGEVILEEIHKNDI